MAAPVNALDVLLQAAGTRVLAVGLPSNTTVDFSQVNGATRPADNADVTQGAIQTGVAVSAGGITVAGGGAIKGGQTDFAVGTGWFLGYSGDYKFSIGSSTKFLRWDGTSLSLRGAITGDSSINITGTAKFGGATSDSGFTWAGVFNSALGSDGGLVAYTASNYAVNGKGTANGATGVWGDASGASSNGVVGSGTTGRGVYGSATSGTGVHGQATSSGGTGVKAENTAGGKALMVLGTMSLDNSTFTWNGIGISPPAGSPWKFLENTGSWVALGKAIKYVAAPVATAGALIGYLTVDTFDGAGQGKIPIYAMV